MESPNVSPPFRQSGERLTRVIATVAGGSLKQFAHSLRRGGELAVGSSRRLLIDYRKGRKPIPETVILRVSEMYPQILPGYLRGDTAYMTAADEQDALQRRQSLVSAATGAAAGAIAAGPVFKPTGYHKYVRESLDLLEQLTPGGPVSRSPLHDVWAYVSDVEGLPEGEPRLKRLRRLVKQVDGLLPAAVRPSGAPLETFRLGVLAAMLAALENATPNPTPRKHTKPRTPKGRKV